jgi:hypothetical protein
MCCYISVFSPVYLQKCPHLVHIWLAVCVRPTYCQPYKTGRPWHLRNFIQNTKFWEELIACFLFTVIWVSDTTSREKTSVCLHNGANKTTQFGRLQCWYYWWGRFMKYTTEMVSDGMTFVPSFMMTGSGVQVILRLLPRESERLQWW